MISRLLSISLFVFACLFAVMTAQAGTGTPVPYQILESGVNSGAVQDKPVLYQIKDAKAWEKFWAEHLTITPKTKPQSIDFNKMQVIAVVDSDQPNSGYRLRLDRIEKDNQELVVYVTREQPAPECINLGMVAQPYVMITLARFDEPVKLIFNTQMRGCNP